MFSSSLPEVLLPIVDEDDLDQGLPDVLPRRDAIATSSHSTRPNVLAVNTFELQAGPTEMIASVHFDFWSHLSGERRAWVRCAQTCHGDCRNIFFLKDFLPMFS